MCNSEVTGRTEERRARVRQRLKYLDSLCASWKDNVNPTQLIRASEDGVLWHLAFTMFNSVTDLFPAYALK